MEQNDGQRRRDSQDGYAPFLVRPALHRDPNPQASLTNAVVALIGLAIIGIVFGLCVWLRP